MAVIVQMQGSLGAVVQSMQAHSQSTMVQERGLRFLALAAVDGGPSAMAVVSAPTEGLGCVASAIGSWAESSQVQFLGFAALWSIVENGSVSVADSSVRMGCVKQIVDGMERHCNHTEVQRWGAATLWSIAEHGSESATQEVVRTGGVEAVVAAMRTHTEKIDVQERGAGTLVAIAGRGGDVALDTIVAVGGSKAVMEAITKFPDSREMEQWGRALADMMSPELATRHAEDDAAEDCGLERIRGQENGAAQEDTSHALEQEGESSEDSTAVSSGGEEDREDSKIAVSGKAESDIEEVPEHEQARPLAFAPDPRGGANSPGLCAADVEEVDL